MLRAFGVLETLANDPFVREAARRSAGTWLGTAGLSPAEAAEPGQESGPDPVPPGNPEDRPTPDE
jgi:hypothetical protein